MLTVRYLCGDLSFRLLELESAGVDTSAPAKSRRKPEEKEEEPQETDEARRIREELERREQQRAERDIRRREGKRLKREAADKARWEGVIAGIEHKVNSKYGYKPSPATETEQVWAPDSFDETPSDDKTNITVGSNGSSGSMFPGSTRGGSTAGKGIGSTRGDRGSVNLTLRSTGESLASQWDDSSTGESSHASGKRWKVAEKKNKAIYSLNPVPGLGTVSAETPSDPVTSTSKATAISRRRGSENW
ncbi:unnamed protein product [Symbiodinium microadriaticum]|nr:unnamed protein product [Symbiodinium microadriaticum]